MTHSVGIYIHFPYCLYKCHYCDFNSYAVENFDQLETEYIHSLLSEIRSVHDQLPSFQIHSIFMGGGTPSLFSPQSIEKVLHSLNQLFPFDLQNSEITLEANPKTLNFQKVEQFKKAGINRFSLGIQSFQDKYLIPLGRIHTGEEAMEALSLLQQQTSNFSLDLMFGFPGQSCEEVQKDLEKAVSFKPNHLSFYQLTPEPGTLFFKQIQKNEKILPSDEYQLEMYEKGGAFLEQKGYLCYEISNFSKPTFESRHNLTYWRYQPYIGFGAGAFSFLPASFLNKNEVYGIRIMNEKNPKNYLQNSSSPLLKRSIEEISFQTASSEFWMMGLRLKEGVSLKEFQSRFGLEKFLYYEEKLKRLIQKGLLYLEKEKVYPTVAGKMILNDVVSELF